MLIDYDQFLTLDISNSLITECSINYLGNLLKAFNGIQNLSMKNLKNIRNLENFHFF